MPVLADLIAHKDFVRRLAVHLVRDEHQADDVTQEVWIRALERAPKGRAKLPGWLARVTRNVASNVRRGDRRRRHHEARAAHPAGSSSVESAEHELGLQHEVVEAVYALDEPYRAVILLRYYKELPHAEIASQLGIPIATVRTRLQRGLARLRGRLDRAYAEDRERWSNGLLLLLGNDVLPLGAGGGGILTGGMIVGTVTKSCIGLAVLAAAAWWIWSPTKEPKEPATSGTFAAAVPTTETAPDLLIDLKNAEVQRGQVVAEAPADAEVAHEALARPEPRIKRGWAVFGRLHDLDPEEMEQVRVSITGITDYSWPEELVATGDVTSDGLFEVDVTDLVVRQRRSNLHTLIVAVDHPRRQPHKLRLDVEAKHQATAELEELEGPITWWVDVRLRTAAVITGRVIGAAGEPVAGAVVGAWAMHGDAPEKILGGSTLSDKTGAFALRVVTPGEHAVCAVDQEVRPASQFVAAELGGVVEAPFPFVLEDGAAISGSLLRLGEPVAEGSVHVAPVSGRRYYDLKAARSPTHSLCWIDGRMELASQRPKTDAEGAFRTVGLYAGEYWVSPGGVPGYRISLGGGGSRRKIMAPARGVDVTYADSSVRITNETPLPPDAQGLFIIEREDSRVTSCDFWGRNGIPSFSGTPAERLVVEVRFEGMHPWREQIVMPSPGDELSRVIELQPAGEPAALEIEPAGVVGVPVTDVSAAFFTKDENGKRLFDRAAEVIDGVARLDTIHPGSYRVVLRGDRWWHHYNTYYLDVKFDVDLAPGQVETRPIALELGGRFAITARDPKGKLLPANVELRGADGTKLEIDYVSRTEDGWWYGTWSLTTRGPCETFPNLPPGDYELELSYSGFKRKVLELQLVPGSSKRVDVVLDPE